MGICRPRLIALMSCESLDPAPVITSDPLLSGRPAYHPPEPVFVSPAIGHFTHR